MGKRATTRSSQAAGSDIGTLWTMKRHERTARCALISRPEDWEVCVLVDGKTLLSEHCDRPAEAFVLGDEWKRRMTDKGWLQVTPLNAVG